MSTPGPAPDVFGYPESRNGEFATGPIPSVFEHARSALVGLALLFGLIITHVSINGL